ncbi:MAG: LysM peptidoglycan-binding domain-containing protein [Clostridia bacterium]|nr:LysM peptidoglycan-binding domain-containing protein [Clostridia bacterium]
MIQIIKFPLVSKFLHRVQQNETFESIAKKYNTSVHQLKKDNNIEKLYAGCVLFVDTNQTKTYIVKPLDTIDSIAKKLNVQKQELIHKNNITRLFIGQKIEY